MFKTAFAAASTLFMRATAQDRQYNVERANRTNIPDVDRPTTSQSSAQNQALDVRQGDVYMIANRERCNLIQGDNVTLLSCPQGTEIYDTASYATNWHLQPQSSWLNYPVFGARNSRETGHTGCLTYIDGNNNVVRVSSENGLVTRTTLMQLNGLGTLTVRDIWVFDNVVAALTSDGNINYWEKPMVLGAAKARLEIREMSSTQAPGNFNLLAWDMSPSADSQDVQNFHAVVNGGLNSWQFVWNTNQGFVTMQQQATPTSFADNNGSSYSLIALPNWIITSCGDCSTPNVKFIEPVRYNTVMNYVQPRSNSRITLDYYKSDLGYLNVYVGGSRIDQISVFNSTAANNQSNVYFNQFSVRTDLFNLANTNYVNDKNGVLLVGAGKNYVTFKNSRVANIFMIANCQFGDKFNPTTYTCSRCLHAAWTVGGQSSQCLLCSQLFQWNSVQDNPFEWAMYSSVCRPGQDKSISVYTLTVGLMLILGCVCCWQSEKHFKKLALDIEMHGANKNTADQIN